MNGKTIAAAYGQRTLPVDVIGADESSHLPSIKSICALHTWSLCAILAAGRVAINKINNLIIDSITTSDETSRWKICPRIRSQQKVIIVEPTFSNFLHKKSGGCAKRGRKLNQPTISVKNCSAAPEWKNKKGSIPGGGALFYFFFEFQRRIICSRRQK